MDKITHQVRAEHWARILNECLNSGMSKTAWCRANGISEKQFFYWQRILRRGIDGLASIVKFNFQLAPYKRRGAGNHTGTISGIDAGTGDRLQASDPGSAPPGSSIRHCAKRRKSKIFSHSPSRTDWKLSTAEPYCIHSIMEYLPAASCRVDKYSEKLKKLVVFSAFQSVYPMVRMTNDLFVWFAFSFVLRYNSSSKTKEHRTCQSQRSTHQKN